MSEWQAVDFLLRAKRQTYTGNGGEEKEPCRPGAHDFRYEEEDYFYMDTYLGGRLFTGEEAVWQKQEKAAVPIWSMNYSGRTLADSFDTGFLKEALGLVDEKSLSGALRFTGKANTCTTVLPAAVWNGFRDRKKFIMVPLKFMSAFFMEGLLHSPSFFTICWLFVQFQGQAVRILKKGHFFSGKFIDPYRLRLNPQPV